MLLRQSTERQRTTERSNRGDEAFRFSEAGRSLQRARRAVNGAFLSHEKAALTAQPGFVGVFFLFCFFNDYYIRTRPCRQGHAPFNGAYLSVIRAKNASRFPASSSVVKILFEEVKATDSATSQELSISIYPPPPPPPTLLSHLREFRLT